MKLIEGLDIVVYGVVCYVWVGLSIMGMLLLMKAEVVMKKGGWKAPTLGIWPLLFPVFLYRHIRQQKALLRELQEGHRSTKNA